MLWQMWTTKLFLRKMKVGTLNAPWQHWTTHICSTQQNWLATRNWASLHEYCRKNSLQNSKEAEVWCDQLQNTSLHLHLYCCCGRHHDNCIAFFSVEIAKLKSQTASVQQSHFDQQMSFLLQQQLQQNNTDAIKALRAESNQHLNTSIDALHSSLNKQINQLNMSINQFHQQAFDNIALQLIEVNSAMVTIYQQLSENISSLKFTADELLNLHLGLHAGLPASSCAALLPTTPSGYYWVSASNGSAVSVYCDMTRSCGGVTGGWVRVGYLDMTDSSHQCPSGFTGHNDSNICTCRRTDTSAGCGSVMMNVRSILISIQESVAESKHTKSVLQMLLEGEYQQV